MGAADSRVVVLGLRVAQLFLAILTLGLTAYGMLSFTHAHRIHLLTHMF